jgi:hypothetical protein
VVTTKPDIVAIMADDAGIWNLLAYHRGMDGRYRTHSEILTKRASEEYLTVLSPTAEGRNIEGVPQRNRFREDYEGLPCA